MADSQEESSPVIRFHYENAPDFKTSYVEHVRGGLTPNGMLHMTFFSEHRKMGMVEESEIEFVDEDHARRTSARTVDLDATVLHISRVQECSVYMSRRSVERLAGWLRSRAIEMGEHSAHSEKAAEGEAS